MLTINHEITITATFSANTKMKSHKQKVWQKYNRCCGKNKKITNRTSSPSTSQSTFSPTMSTV